MKIIFTTILLSALLFCTSSIFGQSPGLIVRPANGIGVTALNPNGDAYSSATTAGFTTNDITQSEIPFKVVPAAITEPTGDLATGSSGGFTDIVTGTTGSGFYMYKDATNIYFRLRIGGIVAGAKGYSVLIDTDAKMGATGPYADPNYVAPSGNGMGNPGFEYEVELQSNSQVAVYSIDGSASPGTPATYSLNSNSQVSVALSTDGNNPDYFYDWFVPLSAIGNPSAIRLVCTTVSSGSSALQGSRSDIYGINDANFANTSGAWQTVIKAQPVISLSSFTGVGNDCTAAPVLTGPISAGTSVAVTGTWTALDASKPSPATITLYKNGSSVGTASCNTGSTWSITVASIANGDVFYTMALASGESQCLQSNNITASACITPPAAPVFTCASLKGIGGTMPTTASGNTILAYLVPTTSAAPNSSLVGTGFITYPTTTSFGVYTASCSGGTNNLASAMYMVVTQNGSCVSAPAFVCISSGSSGTPPPLSANSLALTTPIYPGNTSINGTGATSGDILRLYINGQYQNSITASGSAFSFTGLTLNTGDQLVVYSQTGSGCMTVSSTFNVSCFANPPVITTNSSGNLLNGATTVAGTSVSPGATVQLYKGTAPSGLATGSAVTVTSSGNWSVTVPALVSGDNYYAIQTVSGCASAASSSATVLTPAACPTITGSYSSSNTTITGTMPSSFTGTIRLYEDGALIGSQALSATSSWSITVAAGTLYYNGVLTATAQLSGGTESTGCTGPTVSCTSPTTPGISPTSSTILTGNTVTYTVSSVNAGTWYALLDNTGKSYATSVYSASSSGFTLPSNTFTTTGTYSLQLSANALSGCPASTTAATVTVNSILPLLLINFSGHNSDAQLIFDWTTTEEINVNHFELQESVDGIHFSTISTTKALAADGTEHQYHATINKQLQAVSYYRLKIVDNDAGTQFSSVITLKPINKHNAVVQISPNPFKETIVVQYASETATSLTLTITDMYGRVLRKSIEKVLTGDNQLRISNLGNLSSGTYYLQVSTSGKNQVSVYKIQKLK
jgi:hypothetical protein